MSRSVKVCYGKQDANMADSFPYNCEECKHFNRCREETIKRIAYETKMRMLRGEI